MTEVRGIKMDEKLLLIQFLRIVSQKSGVDFQKVFPQMVFRSFGKRPLPKKSEVVFDLEEERKNYPDDYRIPFWDIKGFKDFSFTALFNKYGKNLKVEDFIIEVLAFTSQRNFEFKDFSQILDYIFKWEEVKEIFDIDMEEYFDYFYSFLNPGGSMAYNYDHVLHDDEFMIVEDTIEFIEKIFRGEIKLLSPMNKNIKKIKKYEKKLNL